MEIGLYIAELLGEQDEVSVPGLGTFIKQRVAGSFDESKNVFNPPSYHLAFKEEDVPYSGLSQYISSKKNLSNASAEELIKKFTSGIKESLNSSDTAEIKHLGNLYKENGGIIFKAIKDFGIAGSFYGLNPIAERDGEASPLSEDEKLQTNMDEIDAPDYTQKLDTEEDEEEAPKARLIPILIISFLAIFATLAALFYFDPTFNQFARDLIAPKKLNTQIVEPLNDSLNSIVADNQLNNTADSTHGIKDSLAVKVNESPEPSKTISEAKPITEVKAVVPISNEGISYEIIVAAFYRKTEAEEYIRLAEAKGMKAKIAENIPGKMHKISMGTFKDEASATKELDRIQKEINKDAWIARVKPLNNSQ